MSIMRPQFVPNHGLRKLLRPMVGQVSEGHGCGDMPWHRCQRLFSTAAIASEDPKSIRITPKRLPKQKRRVMVESFVNKYRTLNAGKFPTVSATLKEVGGSYYSIREILQELEYNFLHNPGVEINVSSSDGKRGAENKLRPEQLSLAENVASTHSRADRETEEHLLEVEKVPCAEEKVFTTVMQGLTNEVDIEAEKRVDSEFGRKSPGVVKVYGGQPYTGEPALVDETGVVKVYGGQPYTGEPALVDEKDPKFSQGFVKPNISTSNKTDDQESPTYDVLRETVAENLNGNDTKENPSIWTNLKTFAGSFFSIWRKR